MSRQHVLDMLHGTWTRRSESARSIVESESLAVDLQGRTLTITKRLKDGTEDTEVHQIDVLEVQPNRTAYYNSFVQTDRFNHIVEVQPSMLTPPKSTPRLWGKARQAFLLEWMDSDREYALRLGYTRGGGSLPPSYYNVQYRRAR